MKSAYAERAACFEYPLRAQGMKFEVKPLFEV